MQPDINAVLADRFGFTQFKRGQREVIDHLLAGRSAAAVFPTGGGKSLCYQLPALLLPGLTLVVSPLIALMKDQIDALAARGITARRLDSTLSLDEYRTAMDEVRSNRVRMLYVAPERFVNERFCQSIERARISLFAVDEAHCISEWGHNFRPDYLRLARFAQLCRAERVLTLTATATEQVLADICRFFHIEPRCAVRTGFYRPNLTLMATPATAHDRELHLFDRLRRREPGPTIVYVTLQRTAEVLAARLSSAGFSARPYHAGMEDADRADVQDWFIAVRQGIVVATIAFGMGIDKADIRYVYHYNPPKSLESYAQEIGRAGRDGRPATCEMFFCPEDLNVLENFAYGDTPTLSAVERLVRQVFASAADFDVSVYELSSTYDIRLSVVRTLLTYLELLGHLEAGTPFYSTYQFKPLRPSAEILAAFDGERRDFLARLFAQAKKAKTWFRIDVDEACQAIGESRDRAVRALDYLAEQGHLELKSTGVRHRYHILGRPGDLAALSRSLSDRLLQRESREIGRLHQVADWVQHDGCQVTALGAHFAEPSDRRCGHCSWCLAGGKASRLPERPAPAIDASVWAAAQLLRQEHVEELRDPRAFARFLCGVSSPWLLRARLQNHPLFGTLAHVPFSLVMARAEEAGG
ncbi:MAG: ATP-dependent DNA helicase RecQ [Thermoguttaceae bacterium]|jgi:ATP-dependent DNA helicase RecQ